MEASGCLPSYFFPCAVKPSHAKNSNLRSTFWSTHRLVILDTSAPSQRHVAATIAIRVDQLTNSSVCTDTQKSATYLPRREASPTLKGLSCLNSYCSAAHSATVPVGAPGPSSLGLCHICMRKRISSSLTYLVLNLPESCTAGAGSHSCNVHPGA